MYRKLLALALFATPGVAHAEWLQASSAHFVVYSEDSPERLRMFTSRLERFDKALRVIFGSPDPAVSPNSRVTIYVVDDVDQIRKLYGAGEHNVAGFMDQRASGSVAFVPRHSGGGGGSWSLGSQPILLHEYAHHFMFSTWPSAVFPMWFVEGFAEVTATAIFKPSGNIVFGAAPQFRVWSVGQANTLGAERLLQLSPGKMSDEATAVLYARGGALTHYLLFDKARSKMLADYIIAINSGKSASEAARIFGNPGMLDLKINNYVARPQAAGITLTPDQVPIGEISVKPVSAGMAATLPAQILSARGLDEERAKKVVELARAAAAPFPNDPGAQNELAEAEFQAGNYPLSLAAAERALAADPKSVHALLYKGKAEVQLAKKDKVTDPARWTAIRRSFIAANKLDTEYPEPLIQFYESFKAANQTAPKSAVAGILYAYALAPFDSPVRISAGRVYLQQGDVAKARIALEPIAYGPHSEAFGELAAKVLAALQEKGAAAALAILDAPPPKPGDTRGGDKPGGAGKSR